MRHALHEQEHGRRERKAMKSCSRAVGTQVALPTGMRTLALLLFPILVGCSEDELTVAPPLPDATPFEESKCVPEFGQVYVMDSIEMLPQGEGLDLNGDGKADNALGVFADTINQSYRDILRSGVMNYLWDFRRWDGPPTEDEPGLELAFYKGLDADSPADPTNNLEGSGDFLVETRQFDVNCQPTSLFEHAALASRKVTAHTSVWEFVQPDLGTVRIADFHFSCELSPNMRRWSGTAGGILTFCGLRNAPLASNEAGTWLDLIVVRVGLPADIDRDGDGIEQVRGNGDYVTHCIDGDGTVLEGADCACDPRIADGYSVAFRGSSVPARIDGLFDAE
jgi:hypothetical protein